MKLFVFLLSALVAISTADIVNEINDILTENATSINVNKLMDLVMNHVGTWIDHSDLLPTVLEDISEKLEFPSYLIKLEGRLELSNGFLTRLLSVVRSGNAIMSYDQSNSRLRITTSASVRQISFRYDYSASFSVLGASGWLEGSTDCLVFTSDFTVDLNDFMIYMTDFRVVFFESINISMKENILIDWLGNLIVNREASEIRGPITDAIAYEMKDIVQQFINKLNRNRTFDVHKDPNSRQCTDSNRS